MEKFAIEIHENANQKNFSPKLFLGQDMIIINAINMLFISVFHTTPTLSFFIIQKQLIMDH